MTELSSTVEPIVEPTGVEPSIELPRPCPLSDEPSTEPQSSAELSADKSAEPSSAELSSAEPIVEPPMPSSAEPSVELLRPSSADVRGKRPRGKLLKTLSAEPKPRSKPLSVELIAEPPRPSSAELSSELTGPMSLELSGKKLSSAEPSAELPLSRRAPCRA